jgi:hypothetical protein
MTRSRRFVLAALVAMASASVLTSPRALVAFATARDVRSAITLDTLPERLTDQEFWRLSEELSEQNGYFQSDNLVSNEIWFPWVVPDLLSRTQPGGGVYLGVGPEQNFNYISVLKPKMVFITDIRRGNLHTQLMYKALFELSADRAEFMSRLFTKPLVRTLTAKSTAADVINAYWDLPTNTGTNNDHSAFKANYRAVVDHLTKTRKLPLSAEDLAGIEYVYHSFYWFGPSINYSSSASNNNMGSNRVTYGDLMLATDAQGVMRHYLNSEDQFRVLKNLEERNLLVPVVGDFAGPKALRAVGSYIRTHGSTVTAFYLSNVEQYLERNGVWASFCANVASMPLTPQSTFIRSRQGNSGGPGGGLVNELGRMQMETAGCGRSSFTALEEVPARVTRVR